MALQEPVRSTLFNQFESLLGTEGAVALMAQFPTYEISEVVTVEQLDHRLVVTEQRLRAEVDERLAAQDARLDRRFDKIDERFAKIDERFSRIDERFADNAVEHAKLFARLDSIDEKMARLPSEMARILVVWGAPIVLTIIGVVFAGVAMLK